MVKFSMYMEEKDVEVLDEARQRVIDTIGVKISRNAFIRSLLFSVMKENTEVSQIRPTNPLQTAD